MWKILVTTLLAVLLPLPDGDIIGLKGRVADAQIAGTPSSTFTSAVATSTYADNAGCYGPTFAIDGYSDNSGCKFFHSKATVPYPYLAATVKPNDGSVQITSVTLKSRCDANGWGHTQINLVIRAGLLPVDPTAAGYTGSSLLPAAAGTLCNTFTGTVAQCSTVTITCTAEIPTNVISVQLYTNGRNVHLMFEDLTYSTAALTTLATATSSSVYYCPYGDFSAYWGPAFAVDTLTSSRWYNFFHSCHETFPWLKVKLPGATTSTTDVTTVTLQTRCDANAWSCSVPNQINVEVRYGQVDIAAGKKGPLTENDYCGAKVGCDAAACQTHTITCDGGTKASHYITVQMLDATKTFLMLNEVTWA